MNTGPTDILGAPVEARRRIKVVGYDGSDAGNRVVAGAARRLRAGDRLIIVHVLAPALDPAGDYNEIWERMLAELGSALDGIDYELRVVNGPVAKALIDVALHTRAQAIVVGTRRSPSRLGQRTIRSQLEAGPVPIVALYGLAEQESHPLAERVDRVFRHSYDSFPASDPPSSWSGVAGS